MTLDPAALALYLITDRNRVPAGRTLLQTVEAALAGGLRMLQLREKDLCADQLYRLAIRMKDLTDRVGALLLINDRIDVAIAAGADGVHLGEGSLGTEQARRLLGDGAVIGRSLHRLEDIPLAAAQGADFATFSPIFFTPSKAAFGPPQGLEKLRRACALESLPILALGGIDASCIMQVRAAGAAGVALISAVMSSPAPEAATRKLLAAAQRA